MILKHTQELLQRKLAEEAFDSYAVWVGLGEDEIILTSDNVDGDTLFDIASCGKILHTMPLILQAIGEGKFTLESTLDEFFDNVPEEKKKITIHQLLTHTSGIIRIPLSKEVCAQGIDVVAAYMLAHPLAFEPGSNYTYSCNGMFLLGFILEKLYGKTLDVLFEEKIKQPLGMTRSRFVIGIDEPNAAICYSRREPGESRFDDDNVRAMGRPGGSGGSFFTLNDVRKYVKAVMEKSDLLLPNAFYDPAEVNYTPDYAEGRGLGFLVVDDKYPQTGTLFPVGSFGHCGHTGQSIFMNRELNLRVVVLSNATRFLRKKSNFTHYDYGVIMAMREEIHNEIKRDLVAEGLLA